MYDQKMIGFLIAYGKNIMATQARPQKACRGFRWVIDKIQLQHASAKDFLTHLNKPGVQVERFIIDKKLFDLDTASNTHKKLDTCRNMPRGFFSCQC